jgi:tRNA pseudouridine55 synthase
MSGLESGLFVLNKPSGITSFDCVNRLKARLGVQKIGHCGTLDPLATGVLLVLFGSATERQESFMGLQKEYWFQARLGILTDSGDRGGRIIFQTQTPSIPLDKIRRLCDGFIGEHWQTPPRVAALKYQGKRYYEWAREGIEIPRAPRAVNIYSFQVTSLHDAIWEGRVSCSRGTYVRSLVADVAEYMGTFAALDALVRERIGPHEVKEALPWDFIREASRDDLFARALPVP